MEGGRIVVAVDDDAHDVVNLRMTCWDSACMVVLMFFLNGLVVFVSCFLFNSFLVLSYSVPVDTP